MSAQEAGLTASTFWPSRWRGGGPSAPSRRPLRWPVEVAGVFALALALWAWAPDPFLIWGAQIAGGELPDYGARFALTPHPLHIGFAALFAPLGDEMAEAAMRALAFVSFAGLAWALGRLGEAVSSTAVGVLAALLVLTNPTQLLVNGTVDGPFVALVAWAAALEARERRRGVPVLALLTLAGLLRPEAWLLAGTYYYVLWLAPSTLADV